MLGERVFGVANYEFNDSFTKFKMADQNGGCKVR